MHCPMKSDEGKDLFVARSAGQLSPGTETALEQHLAFCEECRRVADAQDRVWSALETWKPVPVSAGFDHKLYAKIAAEGESPWWRRALQATTPAAWSWKPAMPVAAACAVLLASFLLKSPPSGDRTEFFVPSSVQTRVDIEQVERALDDMDMLSQLGLASAPAQVTVSGQASL